jgi:hypothetical protein
MKAWTEGSQPELMVQSVRKEVGRRTAESRRRCFRRLREGEVFAREDGPDLLSEVGCSWGIWPYAHDMPLAMSFPRGVRVARQVLRQNAQTETGRVKTDESRPRPNCKARRDLSGINASSRTVMNIRNLSSIGDSKFRTAEEHYGCDDRGENASVR